MLYTKYGPINAFVAHSFGGLALTLALEEINPDALLKAVLIAPATETTTAVNMFFDFLKLDAALRPYFDKVIFEKSGHSTAWFSVARALKNIKSNVLWVHDKDDNMTPFADIENVINEQPPNIQFKITEGLGHRRIYRDNTVAKAVIDFL